MMKKEFYASDIKKIIQWYNILQNAGLIKIKIKKEEKTKTKK